LLLLDYVGHNLNLNERYKMDLTIEVAESMLKKLRDGKFVNIKTRYRKYLISFQKNIEEFIVVRSSYDGTDTYSFALNDDNILDFLIEHAESYFCGGLNV
jgi:hypothetical protein